MRGTLRESAALPTWRALLLAGGRSTRMGRDKALLDWRGQPLLTALRDRLQRYGAASVRVSGDYPAFGGIPDDAPGLGPLAGIDAGLRGAEDGVWLIVPVDMPALGAAQIETLLGTRPESTAACFTDHALPLRLRLDFSARQVLARLMHPSTPGQQRSCRALHAALDGTTIDAAPDLAVGLRSFNTPVEWAEGWP